MVRTRYERKGEETKLHDVDQKWPAGEMVALGIDTALAVDAFGSPAARKLVARWPTAEHDEAAMAGLYMEMTAVVRAELGTIEAAPSTMPEDSDVAPIADYR
jgi:hypothetical protein